MMSYPACSNPCMLLSCCWIKACCWINGNAAAAVGNCASFWAKASVFSRWKSDGNPDGKAEENDGGAAEAKLGVAMENMGVERVWLSPGVCRGKEITGVDRGWLSCDGTADIPWRLGCWKVDQEEINKNIDKTAWFVGLLFTISGSVVEQV